MDIYLPIAGVTENALVLLSVGGGVGLLSGLFGVGGGFLLTPMLIFLGVPAPVAVASGANQVVGASVSGLLSHWRRGNVDFKMGGILLLGGLVGSTAGIRLFSFLSHLGQIDTAIALSYAILLSTVGGLMLVEGLLSLVRRRRMGPSVNERGPHRHYWMHGLPLKTRFYRSRLYISALVPLTIGFLVGVLSAIMGVGGGFIMVPAMIYLIGMPTAVVIGTSLFQIIFVTANITFLQATTNYTVDVFLTLFLLVGGVVGAQFGARLGSNLKAEQIRLLLALMVVGLGLKMAFDLVHRPDDFYSLATELD